MNGDNCVPELHLKQSGFTYSAKQRERIQKFRESGNLKHLYRNESDKACYANDAEYSDSKGVAKKLFQIRFWKKKLIKLIEIVNIMETKEH